jgi:anti-sigma regulatory factor (Ser/Thr protein kinase)
MERDEQLVFMSFCSHSSRLKLLRCVVRDAADMAGLDAAASDEVALAVNEACMNIIQHAYRMDPSGIIDLTISTEPGALVFKLRDYAPCVEPGRIRSRNLDDIRPGGLGIHLIGSLMDESGFLEPPVSGGNLFQMKKFISESIVS